MAHALRDALGFGHRSWINRYLDCKVYQYEHKQAKKGEHRPTMAVLPLGHPEITVSYPGEYRLKVWWKIGVGWEVRIDGDMPGDDNDRLFAAIQADGPLQALQGPWRDEMVRRSDTGWMRRPWGQKRSTSTPSRLRPSDLTAPEGTEKAPAAPVFGQPLPTSPSKRRTGGTKRRS